MAQSAGRWEGDTPFSDVNIFVGPEDMLSVGATTATRNAAGDWSINVGAAATQTEGIELTKILQRFGNLPDSFYNENYGTSTPGNSAGGGIAALTGNQGDPGGPLGRPPYTGATQLVPRVGFKKKGFKLTDVTFIYQITGAAATTNTCRIDKVAYANNVALAITSVLASGANGLATATQANPYVTKVNVGANADWNVTDNSHLTVEWAIATQAGGAFRVYGVVLHGQYNLA